MPRYPEFAPAVSSIGGSVFSSLARRLATYEGETYPLHIGDTWREPAIGCRMQDLTVEDHPGMHRYSSPRGIPELLTTITDHTTATSDVPTTSRNVLVAAGATGALGATIGAMVDPGDEILLLAPYWPLIAGIVRSFHGVSVDVPFFGRADSPETAVEAVQERLTTRTIALYLNTPNNPTGRLIPRPWLEALVTWARANDLWILADEVYELYAYAGKHVWTRSLAPERTFSTHSFSKSYGMAGNRCGWVVGPAEVMGNVRKVSTHTFYSTPTASQIAGIRALRGAADTWVAESHRLYRDLGERAARRLGLEAPQGGTFLFLDVVDRLDDRGLAGFLEDCADRGLFLAPGPSFGPYPTHIRLCFTSAPPEIVERGVEVLARVLGR